MVELNNTLFSETLKWQAYKNESLESHKDIPGWCPRLKAERMMDLVYVSKPKVIVEVGVFCGASVIPQALALKHLNQEGMIYAIDPWEKQACYEGYNPDKKDDSFLKIVDLEKMYQVFLSLIDKFQVSSVCKPIRKKSSDAKDLFEQESIDILHVDGNHSEKMSLYDVETYLPLLKKGGYLWLDDVDWDSTQKAVQFLEKHCNRLDNWAIKKRCSLYQKL